MGKCTDCWSVPNAPLEATLEEGLMAEEGSWLSPSKAFALVEECCLSKVVSPSLGRAHVQTPDTCFKEGEKL